MAQTQAKAVVAKEPVRKQPITLTLVGVVRRNGGLSTVKATVEVDTVTLTGKLGSLEVDISDFRAIAVQKAMRVLENNAVDWSA